MGKEFYREGGRPVVVLGWVGRQVGTPRRGLFTGVEAGKGVKVEEGGERSRTSCVGALIQAGRGRVVIRYYNSAPWKKRQLLASYRVHSLPSPHEREGN